MFFKKNATQESNHEIKVLLYMARRRFFVDKVSEGEANLTGDDAHHLTRVLRVEPGQQFEISDSRNLYLAEIAEVRKDRVRFRVIGELDPGPGLAPITLVVALIKFDRLEWLIEKATELGVARIVPVEAARSEAGLLAAAGKRVERWRRIARESGRQSRRMSAPVIDTPGKLTSAIGKFGECKYVLDEAPGGPPLISALGAREHPNDCALLVGPEGGWTASEREGCAAAGWSAVSLGPTVLRTETAAIAAVAIFTHEFNSKRLNA